MNAKLQHKIDLQQNSVSSEQNIYPSHTKLYTRVACPACDIWKVCHWGSVLQPPLKN